MSCSWTWCLILVPLALGFELRLSAGLSAAERTGFRVDSCEPLDSEAIPLCHGIAYNQTRFPNFMKQASQAEAGTATAIYMPLIRIGCSPVLKLFLCSLYAPPCISNFSMPLRPCREMCQKARRGCEDVMQRHGFGWPEYFDCDNFPSFNGPEACVTDESYPSSTPVLPTPERIDASILSRLDPEQLQALLKSITASALDLHPRVKFVCPPKLHLLGEIESKHTYYLSVNDELVPSCGMPCDRSLFSPDEVVFGRSWVLTWSSLCFASTFFTMLTFLIETNRFKYPERPIIYLSACYLVVSLAFIIGSTQSDNSIVCRKHMNSKEQSLSFLVQGVEHVPCTILFMMTYYFSMASSIWWVVLTLTWFLAAGLKWGHEAIENIASYFHLAAWLLPAFKLIAVLWMQRIDADILSGICFTGIRNLSVMRGFVLAPLIVYLILGSCFLMAGFVSLVRIRNVMKHEGNKTDKLERFMVRIGVFSILYMVPAIIVICCLFYEQTSYHKWIDKWLYDNRLEFNLAPDYVNNLFESERVSFVFSFFMLKYTMLLVVGITSGFWIWSNKTISSWQRFFDRIIACCGGYKPSYKHEAAV
nr:G protein-coupled receptor [Proales similis]